MLKVIIVDDELLERKALSKIISTEFPDVEVIDEAPNGRVAIEKAQLHQPDLMLMDIKMPGIDGVEAVKQIKELLPDTKFIMVSAFNTFEYAKEVMKQGVKDYILKPSRKEDILASVERVKGEIEQERKQLEEQKELRARLKQLLALTQNEGFLEDDHSELVDAWKSNQAKKILTKAKEYIENKFSDSLTLEEVAEHVELSPVYFSKFFKENFGVTFIDYVTTIRMNHAKKEMKDPTKSLKEICYSVGYKDPNYFSRAFKKYTGLSPTEYRSITQG
ncbi:response regulator transcription factor [Fredinandcohnia sp. 179-A 10B2 NHS]|uniref:response regulator transcription factor n=1 Tax=Fredinandcohnia sp. 179-A 10B2 NHS TaxID=3235176 RepID=UPI0039A11232